MPTTIGIPKYTYALISDKAKTICPFLRLEYHLLVYEKECRQFRTFITFSVHQNCKILYFVVVLVPLILWSYDLDSQGAWLWEPFGQLIGKLSAQLYVFHCTFQADPQLSWKLLNYYITLALLSMAGVPI